MILPVLVLPALIGFAGLAVEGGLWYADRHQLRAMADAAVLAAAWARRDGTDEFTAAVAAAEVVGFDGGTDELELNVPPLSGAFAGDADAIEVVVRRTRALLISTLFLDQGAVGIGIRAVARFDVRSAPCVLALSSNEPDAIKFSGSANVTIDGCGVSANSTAGSALNLNDSALTGTGNATMSAEWAQVVGSISVGSNADLITDMPPEENSAPRPDPFAGVPTPERPPDCPTGTQATYTPCTFVGDWTLGSGAVSSLQPGVYFVDGGTFRVNGGATLIGTGVTVYLTGNAAVRFNGGATVALEAPSTGSYAGLAFMQDRAAPAGISRFNGGVAMDIQGSIYLPNQEVEFSGGSSFGGGCTRLVSRTVTFTGNTDIYLGNDCAAFGLSETVEDEPRLVE